MKNNLINSLIGYLQSNQDIPETPQITGSGCDPTGKWRNTFAIRTSTSSKTVSEHQNHRSEQNDTEPISDLSGTRPSMLSWHFNQSKIV